MIIFKCNCFLTATPSLVGTYLVSVTRNILTRKIPTRKFPTKKLPTWRLPTWKTPTPKISHAEKPHTEKSPQWDVHLKPEMLRVRLGFYGWGEFFACRVFGVGSFTCGQFFCGKYFFVWNFLVGIYHRTLVSATQERGYHVIILKCNGFPTAMPTLVGIYLLSASQMQERYHVIIFGLGYFRLRHFRLKHFYLRNIGQMEHWSNGTLV